MKKRRFPVFLGVTACVVGTVAVFSVFASWQAQPPTSTVVDETLLRWSAEDWEIFSSKVRLAEADGLGESEVGEAAARIAGYFLGTTYTPGTLEAEGPEGLVINFREFDCVTFVENVLAIARFVRSGGVELLDDPPTARVRYETHLTDLRYRGGVLDGYPSRLHYFSEWLADNERKGLIRRVTEDLGAEPDTTAIDFMSKHPEAYRQLAAPDVLDEIVAMEGRLRATGPRHFISQDRIGDVAPGIRGGDVIAATSTVAGLDVAHTGIAVWREGELHLLHAPLVGSVVEISELPLAERILNIGSQDGIMVARPVDRVVP